MEQGEVRYMRLYNEQMTTLSTRKDDTGTDNEHACTADVGQDKEEETISKSQLKSLIDAKISLKLEVDWFKEWYNLLSDKNKAGDRGISDNLLSSVRNHVGGEELKELETLQKGYEDIWDRLQLTKAVNNKIHGIRRSITKKENLGNKHHTCKEDEISDLCTIENQIDTLKKEIVQLRNNNNSSNLEHELKVTKDELQRVTREKEDVLTRLSQIAGNKLHHNNAEITDLSDKNRPTNLAEKFNELYDNEWTDAFDHLTETTSKSQETTIADLLSLVKDVYTECNSCATAQRNNLSNALQLSAREDENTETNNQDKPQSVAQYHVQRQIVQLQKSTAEFTITRMKTRLKSTLKLPDGTLITAKEHCSPYIDRCIELCWYMNIQEKPVVLLFDFFKGDKFCADFYRHYTKTGTTCDYLVWPAMLLHKDGPLLQKGVMQPE